jgi:HprK-related kinase A
MPTTQPTILEITIGDTKVSVTSVVRKPLDDLASLYSTAKRAPSMRSDVIRMSVSHDRRTLWGSGRYVVSGDGQVISERRRLREILPFLEWGINWRVIARRSDHLLLHAATLSKDGRGVILAGESGSGKSTLSAALLARGWQYCCDELAIIEPNTLHLQPFPKAICIKSTAFDTIKKLNLTPFENKYYVKALKGKVGYIRPQDVRPNAIAEPSPVRLVVFPRYVGRDVPIVYPIRRGRAAFMLAQNALNRLTFQHDMMRVLTQIVQGVPCVGIESGRIDRVCDRIESLVERGP